MHFLESLLIIVAITATAGVGIVSLAAATAAFPQNTQ